MYVRVAGRPLARGEMRPLVDHTEHRFALARCTACPTQSWVSERAFRLVARDPEACLICPTCGARFHPVERLDLGDKVAPDLWTPRKMWG